MYVDKKSTLFHGPNMLKNERIPLTARELPGPRSKQTYKKWGSHPLVALLYE